MMKKGFQAKKKHHFIPKFYLSGFVNQQGMIWAYSKAEPKKPPHCSKPENTAFERNFYAIQRDDGSLNSNIVEDYFAEYIENPSAKSLKELRLGQIPLSEDREGLSLLSITLYLSLTLRFLAFCHLGLACLIPEYLFPFQKILGCLWFNLMKPG